METNPDRALGKLNHFLSVRDFSVSSLINLMRKTLEIKNFIRKPKGPELLLRACAGKQMVNVFFQDSTRTRSSSSSAAASLGMFVENILGTKVDGEYKLAYTSLYSKGAAFLDEMMTYAAYFDLINIRAHKVGMAEEIAREIDRRGYNGHVINSADGEKGEGEHPTQAATNIYTFFGGFGIDIEKDWKRLPQYSVAFINDCRNRVVRSDSLLMGKALGMELKYCCVPGLEPDELLQNELKSAGVRFSIHYNLQPASVASISRIPEDWLGKERTEEILRSGQSCSITRRTADEFGYAGVMHAFPRFERGNELPSRNTAGDLSLDDDDRAWYWKQIRNGKFVRMAVILMLLNPSLELESLRLQELNASFIGQCYHCGRLQNSVSGWGDLKAERYKELPLLPFCPKCQKK
ncbi:hypothetical protein A2662_02715 [Candidatus Giovannonibacteria bacterium RIFCSPHIGHO2_01_FULL_45_33]|uniref:Uncharacterized protein n=1 Tax=Candidatus Giovannonibacteria bacterium RIFCSPLOWO2_01_FULL_45_34 TaxID=1798351 RepID=A0A1F5X1G2_9BACT|nr:MAG: hypothetical protein A2662_02715 [Candidatus Giovannonibacteria bacterium RIFCSPHIGHO2_01_FULL_45_33]OGF70939.1 MAG: hypothetical protein A3C73_01020 [Candidatus Giovannonibacteria bacterium RIFCSPHIGHO2_02_FULL_44_11]OGF81738.1 MAG: hypothetical protein A2930_04030 [Candidatus Giovannonibacteria bacterium RIFCSPLOWO2_01_FULL_45_34]